MINPKSLKNLQPGKHPHTKKHPGGYLVPKLKKLLSGKMPAKDKKTRDLIKSLGLDETIGTWTMFSLLMAAVQNQDISAIKEILDRTDGKVTQTIVGEGIADQHIVIIRNPEAVKEEQTADTRTAIKL